MTERALARASTVSSTRRTAALVVLWVAAALIAGVPSDAGATAGSELRAKKPPVYVIAGPGCFAGHSAIARRAGAASSPVEPVRVTAIAWTA